METLDQRVARWATLILGMLFTVVLIVSLALFGYGQYKSKIKAQDDTHFATATTAAAVTKAQKTAEYVKTKEEVRVRTQEVLDSQPEYRDADVPADVADLLREPTDTE